MTDVLSEEEAREILIQEYERGGRGDVAKAIRQRIKMFEQDVAICIAAIIRATSSRPSGAEAMREAAAEALEREADRCEVLAQMLSPPSKAPNAELAYLHEQGAALLRDVANRCVRALSIAPQEVSEEMVEAAAKAAYEAAEPTFSKAHPWNESDNAAFGLYRTWTRAALQAALSVKEKKNG